MAKRSDITPEIIRQLIRFDRPSGKYLWNWRPRDMFNNERTWASWNIAHADKDAMTATNSYGYSIITIFCTKFMAHRVIWAYHYGEWPINEIDHINGIKRDNRLENLRDVTTSENQKNRCLAIINTSGSMGVGFHKRQKKWRAYIASEGKQYHLGTFKTQLEALEARRAAEIRFGFHPNHGRPA